MAERRLAVRLDDAIVGELQETDGLWAFEYAPAWIASPAAFDLSPALDRTAGRIVDGASRRPVQWFFDNLLPEEAMRSLVAADAGLDSADAFGLLAFYGAESAGSLTLLPSGVSPPARAEYVPLSESALQARIEGLPRRSLIADAPKKMSLAGAQNKLPVAVMDGALFEPRGAGLSTHILKPDHSSMDFPHSVVNEYFVMRLARRLRLPVPAVARRYVPAPVYVVERFDREQAGGAVKRRHAIDACQLLDLAPAFKYSAASVEALRRAADLCRVRPAARVALFRWLVFVLLTGNNDAHLKNLTFFASAKGFMPAPAYDLLCTAAYETPAMNGTDPTWPNTRLAWDVLGAGTFADVTSQLLVDAARVLGLSEATGRRVLTEMTTRIEAQAERVLDEIEAENGRLRVEASVAAGEMRLLRAVVYVVIREMAGRLRG